MRFSYLAPYWLISRNTMGAFHLDKKSGTLVVRVKGGMSLRNGMWHGLRNDIIMRNVKYGNWRKEIN